MLRTVLDFKVNRLDSRAILPSIEDMKKVAPVFVDDESSTLSNVTGRCSCVCHNPCACKCNCSCACNCVCRCPW